MGARGRKPATLEIHGHAVLSGPLYQAGTRDITHAHEGGDRAHRHPGTGPAHYQRDRYKKYTVRPNGPQLPTVPLTDEERTFRVVFVDKYTDGHRAAGISPERFAAERAAFLAGGQAPAVARMVETFDMVPVYELHTPQREGE